MKDFTKIFTAASGEVFQALEINLNAKAGRAALTLEEYIQSLRARGISEDEIYGRLQEDLQNDGRIFGEFFRALGIDIPGRMSELSKEASNAAFGFGKKDKVTWIAVSVITAGGHACPDCAPRHQEVDTYQNWVIRGLPGTGWSVCRTNCKCRLLSPDDIKGFESLKNPILVNKED